MTRPAAGDRPPCDTPDLPDGLILFDGVCVLCSGWVRFVIARPERALPLRADPIRLWPGPRRALRDRPGRARHQRRGRDRPGDFRLDAALAILATWPRWRWTAILRALPRPWRDALYDRIARNRYRIFGRTAACMVPTADVARRFLTHAPG